ncbi:MAG: ribulose-phosphate 3-epimerase [Proteobacteria bacterium]|nr:ribulose-phosphate 3-epimerase [Pseudomonadota bacterium]MBU4289376.1 ribulose-phosphate 3-epimerase [Pseudomonadota bacterium]MCG2757081.1 ribulose-phosphate 3-epimerase [Desulfobacteraceae bacterium]
MRIIAPSILSADFTKLGDEIKSVEDAGADWIHVDVMDGHFVPAITMGPIITKAARSITSLPLDVHLMIENPDLYITDFVKAGATLISVHVEACVHLNRTIQMIKDLGIKAGVAINPSTPLSSLDWILEFVDFVLIMSVNPGFGGQVFIPNSIDKIKDLRKMIKKRKLSAMIEIDGGVTEKNIEEISIAGADAFVAGSAIFGTQDYKKTISFLK